MFIQRSSSYFFNQIIDYAGFFPPSQLPIEEAFYNFLDYQYVHYRHENTVEKKKFIETKSSGDSKIYKELFLGKHDYEERIVNF